MNNWHTWLGEAMQFERAGRGKDGAPSKLAPVIVYNLYAMALEKYAMAILDYHNKMPDNHTFSDLIDGLEKVVGLDEQLRKRVLDLERQQQICAFDDNFQTAGVDLNVTMEFDDVIREFGRFAREQCEMINP